MMKRILGAFFVLVTLSLAAVAQCSDADKKALEAFDRAWGKAGETGDKAALMNIYADDYVGMPGMQGKSATIESTMKTFEKDKANPSMADKVSHDNYLITCTPNSATITHRNVIWTPSGAGGKAETFYTRSVHVLEKRGGKWQVVSNAGHGLDDYMTLGYMEMDWMNAVKGRDMAWFDKNYASDYSEISFMTGDVMDRAGSINALKNDKTVFDDMGMSDLNIRIEGNTAIVTGIGWGKGKDGEGKPFDMKMRFTDTYVKRDGRWQAWASQATMIPKPADTAKK
jgi:ketosteroid isomerase-like protein